MKPLNLFLLASFIIFPVFQGAFAQAQDTLQADKFHAKADSFLYAGAFDSSLASYQKALKIYKQCFPKKWQRASRCYSQLAWGNYLKGNIEIAFQWLDTGSQTCNKYGGAEHFETAMNYNIAGLLNRSKGNQDIALNYHEKALKIRQHSTHVNAVVETGTSFHNIGQIYLDKGDYDNAIEYFQQAYNIWIKSFKRKHRLIQNVENNMGIALAEKRDFKGALLHFAEALDICRNVFSPMHHEVARILNNIGNVYAESGVTDSALFYFRKSLTIRQKIFNENHPLVGSNFYNIGTAYMTLNQTDSALFYGQKAITIQQSVFGEIHYGTGDCYAQLGKIFMQKKEIETALKYFQKSLISLVSGFTETDIYKNPILEINNESNKTEEKFPISSENLLLTTLIAKGDGFYNKAGNI